MPKFIIRKELENMYSLVSTVRPVGVIQSCFAIGAKDVVVVETFFGYLISAAHIDTDDVTCFNINIDTFIEKEYVIMKNAISGISIFISKHFGGYLRPLHDRVKDYVGFVDFSIQKDFSRWLHTEDPESYDIITENNMFLPNVRFKQKFNIEEIINFIKYDKGYYDEEIMEISFWGSMNVPLEGNIIQAIKEFSHKTGNVYCYEDDSSVKSMEDIVDYNGELDIVIPYTKSFVIVSKDDFFTFINWFYDLHENVREHFTVTARLTFDSNKYK